MLKKTVTYKDCDNVSCTENFYFNLTEAEILELQVSRAGGYAESMQVLVDSKDPQLILSVIKEFVLSAYGERGEVSRKFSKKRDDTEAFSHTEAFSIIFMDLFKNPDRAADFFNGLMPEGMMEAGKAEQAKQAMIKAPDDGHEPGNLGGPRPRLVPQDHLKKAEPVFSVVKDVPMQTELSLVDFTALSQADRLAFIEGAGKIV